MGLDYISCSLGLGKSLSYPCFTDINRDLLVVVEHIANKSIQKAIDQLRDLNGLMPDEKVHITGSYDGAYQKRSSKNSGGDCCKLPTIWLSNYQQIYVVKLPTHVFKLPTIESLLFVICRKK